MALREILTEPNNILRKKSIAVERVDEDLQKLMNDMLETMYAAPGRGIAGPQVGAMLRIFVMDAGWKEDKSDPLVCINPMFQEIGEERVTNTEGCLSIPGISTDISRPSQVQMVWTGLNGGRYVQSFEGAAALIAQHEMDHLDGVVTFDHLDAETRAAKIAEFEAQ